MSEPTRASATSPESGSTASPDGARIAWRRWAPAAPARASVVVLHGVGEHGGRYAEVAEQLVASGYAVTAPDFRGFGLSSGRRGDLRLGPALEDVDRIIEQERARSSAPVFLYGHSLGGLVAFLYGVDRQPDLAGVVLTGPAFDTVLRDQKAKLAVVRVLGRLLPGLAIPSGLPVDRLNRDPAVVAAYRSDPLVHDRGTLGLALDAFAAMDHVRAEAHRFTLPLLVVQGGADSVNPLAGSQSIIERVPGDKALEVYDGVHHAVEHEPERPEIIADVVRWLDAHLPS